jgi:plasmid stability protein
MMPTLVVENVPAEVYERLQKRAAAQQRTLPEEMMHLLRRVLSEEESPARRLPDFIHIEEVSPSCDLPRSSQPVLVVASTGQPRLPDILGIGDPE